MRTRPDIYLQNGYLKPGIIAPPGTPSEVLPQVLQYFAPKGARLPHKFRQTFRKNRIFKMWEKWKFYVDEHDNQEIMSFFADLRQLLSENDHNLPFHFFDTWDTQLHGVKIRHDYADGKHQVFEAMPTRKPHGLWSLKTPTEIQLFRSRKHLYTIQNQTQ